jgi:hypothetical protein
MNAMSSIHGTTSGGARGREIIVGHEVLVLSLPARYSSSSPAMRCSFFSPAVRYFSCLPATKCSSCLPAARCLASTFVIRNATLPQGMRLPRGPRMRSCFHASHALEDGARSNAWRNIYKQTCHLSRMLLGWPVFLLLLIRK